MTRDEILALEAGHELNVLVAETMGYQVFERYGYHYIATDEDAFEQGMTHGLFWEDFTHHDEMRLCLRLPRYSTSIRATWEVVEKMVGGNGCFELLKSFGGWWEASFVIVLSNDDERRKLGYGNWRYTGDGDTASVAICRAALLVKEGANEPTDTDYSNAGTCRGDP